MRRERFALHRASSSLHVCLALRHRASLRIDRIVPTDPELNVILLAIPILDRVGDGHDVLIGTDPYQGEHDEREDDAEADLWSDQQLVHAWSTYSDGDHDAGYDGDGSGDDPADDGLWRVRMGQHEPGACREGRGKDLR
jgi:hypothetical protein